MSSVRLIREDIKGFYIRHEGMRWYAEDNGVGYCWSCFPENRRVKVNFSGIGLAGGGFAETVGFPNIIWISECCP